MARVVGLQPPYSFPALPWPSETRVEPCIFAWGKHHFGHVAAVMSKHWLCSRYREFDWRDWQLALYLHLPGASHDERSL